MTEDERKTLGISHGDGKPAHPDHPAHPGGPQTQDEPYVPPTGGPPTVPDPIP